MIFGFLNASLEIVVPLRVRNPNGQNEKAIEAILDTGFDDCLTLPPELITELGLTVYGSDRIMLADGTIIETATYLIEIIWESIPTLIRAQEAAGAPLLGMLQLFGNRVTFDVKDGGTAEIVPLTP